MLGMFVAERIGSVGRGIEIFAKIAIGDGKGTDRIGPTGDSVGGESWLRNRRPFVDSKDAPYFRCRWGKRPPWKLGTDVTRCGWTLSAIVGPSLHKELGNRRTNNKMRKRREDCVP